MKQRKLRGYVLPTLYVIILMFIFGAVSLVSSLMKRDANYMYATGVLKDISTPVVETKDEEVGIIRPYTSESVSIDKHFYDAKSDEATQENSLIYFQNTYMKNTGVLYKSEDAFDCVAVLDGTVLNVKEDDVLGKMVEIEHNTNLRTIYYSLSDIEVSAGNVISKGEIIGKSGASNITENKNNLLFEVYYNGKLINPEEFYKMDAGSLN